MRKYMSIAFLAAGLLCGCPEADTGKKDGKTDGKTDPAKPDGTKPADGKKVDEFFWKEVGKGTVVEQKMVTDMTKPAAFKSETVMKYTLKDKTDKDYTLTTEMTAAGTAMPGTDATTPWPATGEPAKTDAKTTAKDMGDEDVKVGSDTFKCKHWQSESDAAGVKTTTDSWMYHNLMLKMVSKSDNGTTTCETTKIDKK